MLRRDDSGRPSILSDEFLASLESSVRPVEEAEMLTRACYTDPQLREFEKEAPFAHESMCRARSVGEESSSAIPEPHQRSAGIPEGERDLLPHALPAQLRARMAAGATSEQRTIFGPDPGPYNLDDNCRALEAVVRYEFEQGMIRKKPSVEQLLFPPSLQEIQHYL